MSQVAESMPSRTPTFSLRTVAHVAGNVLLGVALGLLGYQGITDVRTRLTQRRLVAENPGLNASVVVSESATETTGPVLDFAGWEAEDRAAWMKVRQGRPLARIVAERIRLDAVVVKGTDRESLKRGPGWLPKTDPPGPTGNVGIAGHRTTYGAPFRTVDRLRSGDIIDLYTAFRRYRYEVERVFVVTPDQVEVMETSDVPILTLSACHPPYSARQRIIVRARLVEVLRTTQTGGRQGR